ncbi:MAG: OmpA family protein [Nannocystaceae bacterium]
MRATAACILLFSDLGCSRQTAVSPPGAVERSPERDARAMGSVQAPAERIDGPEVTSTSAGALDPTELPDLVARVESIWILFPAAPVDDPRQAPISADAEASLLRLVGLLHEHPSVRIEVSGHADTMEAGTYSRHDTSQARAYAVKSFLVDHGVEPERIETRAAGVDEPVDTSTLDGGRARNRRVDFTVLTR